MNGICVLFTVYTAGQELLDNRTHMEKEGMMVFSISRLTGTGLRSLCSLRLKKTWNTTQSININAQLGSKFKSEFYDTFRKCDVFYYNVCLYALTWREAALTLSPPCADQSPLSQTTK